MIADTIKSNLGTNQLYFRQGNPTVLFLGGWDSFATQLVFSPVIDKLNQSFGMLTFDYLNTGASGLAKRNYMVSEQVEELVKYIQSHNLKRIIIVAHSIGGLFALRLASELADVIGMVLIEPTTKEVALNQPQNEQYHKMMHQYDDLSPAEVETILKNRVYKNFSPQLADSIWAHYQTASQLKPQFDCVDFPAAISDNFKFKINKRLKSIIFTEPFRIDEFKRSEYFNPDSEIIGIGTDHYLYWQFPDQITAAINRLADQPL